MKETIEFISKLKQENSNSDSSNTNDCDIDSKEDKYLEVICRIEVKFELSAKISILFFFKKCASSREHLSGVSLFKHFKKRQFS